MADVQRHKYGALDPAIFAVDAAKVFSGGDLAFLETDDARAADQVTYGVTLSASKLRDAQLEFAAKFVGVALSKKDSTTVAGTVRLGRSGVFEFTCASATFEVGDKVGPAANGGGTALENQKVVAVTDERRAIGKVAKRGTSVTKVLVAIDPELAKAAITSRCIQGGEELACITISQQASLVPAGLLRAGTYVISGHGVITEVMAGSTQDQGIITIYDTDNVAIMTLTPTDVAADALNDIVLGSISRPATGTLLVAIAAGKGIYAKVTQATAGTPAGKMKVWVELALAA